MLKKTLPDLISQPILRASLNQCPDTLVLPLCLGPSYSVVSVHPSYSVVPKRRPQVLTSAAHSVAFNWSPRSSPSSVLWRGSNKLVHLAGTWHRSCCVVLEAGALPNLLGLRTRCYSTANAGKCSSSTVAPVWDLRWRCRDLPQTAACLSSDAR